jgi:hypothetical protein
MGCASPIMPVTALVGLGRSPVGLSSHHIILAGSFLPD